MTKYELFARRERPGWVTVGNECPGTIGVNIREWFAARVGQEAA
jgi:N6-adenosine-specific RNA methylase IME4